MKTTKFMKFLQAVFGRSSRLQMFFEIGVSKIFEIFTGKYLYWSLFLLKLQAWNPEFFKNTYSSEHLRTATSESLYLWIYSSFTKSTNQNKWTFTACIKLLCY